MDKLALILTGCEEKELFHDLIMILGHAISEGEELSTFQMLSGCQLIPLLSQKWASFQRDDEINKACCWLFTNVLVIKEPRVTLMILEDPFLLA